MKDSNFVIVFLLYLLRWFCDLGKYTAFPRHSCKNHRSFDKRYSKKVSCFLLKHVKKGFMIWKYSK